MIIVIEQMIETTPLCYFMCVNNVFITGNTYGGYCGLVC